MVKDLFRDEKQTEFVIATIPSVLGVNESARLATSLHKDSIPCRRIIVNQASLHVIDESSVCNTSFDMKCNSYPLAWRRCCTGTLYPAAASSSTR